MDRTQSENLRLPARCLSIDLRRLQQIVTAADHGSFRQAAQALSIKQSTLSRSVQLLEDRLGVSVFERSTGGVRVTPAGLSFLRTARSILEQMNALVATAGANGHGETGRVVIGFLHIFDCRQSARNVGRV